MTRRKLLPILILGSAVMLGLILRTVRLQELAGFDFDQETAAWWVDGLLRQHHFSLIGQETSVPGVFIAPFFYYLLAPFYLLSGGDPVAGNVLVSLISVLTMVMIFVLGKELFKTKAALLAVFFYTLSFRVNFYDRTVAPSNLVIFLSLFLFYSVWKVRHGQSNWLLAIFLVIGLGASIHPAILLYAPLCLFLTWQSRRQISPWIWILGVSGLILLTSPLLLFEWRHGFTISQAILKLISTPGANLEAFVFRLGNNWVTVVRSVEDAFLTLSLGGLALSALFFLWLSKNPKQNDREKLFFLWLFWPLLILSLYPRAVPEYYFLPILSLSIVFLPHWFLQLVNKQTLLVKFFPLMLLTIFHLSALASYSYPVSLAYKKQAVDYIAQVASSREVDIHYSTDLGQKNGFSYLLFWRGLRQSSNSKERYRIVVPAKNVLAPGMLFGAVKVIKE